MNPRGHADSFALMGPALLPLAPMVGSSAGGRQPPPGPGLGSAYPSGGRSLAPELERLESETIEAYERLAPEYDGEDHATTRTLEALTIRAYESLPSVRIPRRSRVWLEIGCGTGRLSAHVAERLPQEGVYVLSDPSPGMLARACTRLEESRLSLAWFRASAFRAETFSGLLADHVVCGLADPYLVTPAVQVLSRLTHADSSVFVTVPDRAWALDERERRLNTCPHRTRFRLRSGGSVLPFSFTYSPIGLGNLLEEAGWEIISGGRLGGPSGKGGEPAIAWAFARRRSMASRGRL